MRCIYCPNEADGREHWLPEALGVFGPVQVLHDCICTRCNETFGRTVDQEFIRTGPEGLMRAALGFGERAGHQRGNPFYYRAASAPALRAVQIDPTADERGLLWETYSGAAGEARGKLLEQIVVQRGDGMRVPVPLNIAWTADTLRQAPASAGFFPCPCRWKD